MTETDAVPVAAGLAGLIGPYRAVLCDLWGAVHDGIRPYPGAVECLLALRASGRRVVLLSNAPRPSHQVRGFLAQMGVPDDAYDDILTSGDATVLALNGNGDAFHAAIGRRYYHIGPERSASLLEAVEREAAPFDEADFLLASGLVDDESETAEDYRPLLERALARDMAMVCANPDVRVNRGDRLVPCAGALAGLYEAMGGRVARHGKPLPGVYRLCLERLGLGPCEVLMLGDGLATDIRGARNAGLDSVWIAGGMHAGDVGCRPGAPLDGRAVAAFCARHGERPTFAVPALRW